MNGWYEVSKSDGGQFSFVLKAGNDQVVLRSQAYASRQSAMAGIASVQANAALDERYELDIAKDGRPYFNLKAANGQVVGTSQMYASSETRAVGIASVKANAASTDVRDT